MTATLRSHVRRHTALLAALGLVAAVLLAPGGTAGAHQSGLEHGGEGSGLGVVGHNDLQPGDGREGLTGHMEVLGDHAYVGEGTNGGTAFQWNKTPRCNDTDAPVPDEYSVKVVNLADPSDPQVVAEIPARGPDVTLEPEFTLVRDIAVLDVEPVTGDTGAFTGDLLAVAQESCSQTGAGAVGVNFYDITDPANPEFLGRDERSVGNTHTRHVSLVQVDDPGDPDDGRVYSLEANQGGFAGGIHVVDVTVPNAPAPIGTFDRPQVEGAFTTGECRPFGFAQGVTANEAGTRAYAAYQDHGLFVLDLDDIPAASGTDPLPQLDVVDHVPRGADEEGNSFRFTPNDGETAALATSEDLNPADTTVTVDNGSAADFVEPGGDTPGEFRGCEAVWGKPLYTQDTPSVDGEVAFALDGGCDPADYPTGKSDYIALTTRGGEDDDTGGICTFDEKARTASAQGAVALLIHNSTDDHHGDGSGVLFSPDSVEPVDAGVDIPLAMITQEAGLEIRDSIAETSTAITATIGDSADTWGALDIFDLTGSSASKAATYGTANTTSLPNSDELFHIVQAEWDGDRAVAAAMSDGVRVLDLSDPSAPQEVASFVPQGVSDPTGNYPAVPLVVDVAVFGDLVLATDINDGLYVLGEVPAECTIVGTFGDDTLQGTDGDDVICGLGGDDTITAGDGDDTVLGGDGDDVVDGEQGDDTLDGEGGDDLVRGGRGVDGLTGGDGADTLDGGRGDDTLDGVDGVEGNDALDGGLGADSCAADPGDAVTNCES